MFPQNDSLIVKKILISESSILIHRDFIDQNNFNIYKDNTKLPDSLYSINFSTGLITFNKQLIKDTVLVQYKLLNPDFSYSKRDISLYIPVIEKEPTFLNTESYNSTAFQKLQTNGTFQRTFSNGNNQNFSINTDIDLQISGKISDDLFLDCNISDSSIPIEYGQSTTSLQEIDRVYITLYNKKMSLKGGDILTNNLANPFLNFSRNSIGLSYNKVDSNFQNTTSIGITKNIFRRQIINPINGNQGPYKLIGNNNELYVLIIPDSEKVFIDGIKQEKGTMKDYTINYNTGEVTFTANTIINENQRIIIEFQYSGQNYFRWLSYFGSNFKKGDFTFKFNFFSEQDSKSNPILSLSENQTNQLIVGGDESIFSNTFNVVEYTQSNTQILYTIKDTIDLNYIEHDNIYVFSNNPIDTLYNVHFEYVGEGQGDYILEQNLLNGNVFVWTAPFNGLKQGDYEPKKLLASPQKKQMFTVGFDYQKQEDIISVDFALSNYDKNVFSSIDDDDNISWAMNIFAKKKYLLKKVKLQSIINYEFVEKNFSYIDRTRDLEFSRNWNITDSILLNQRQHKMKFNILSEFLNIGTTSYTLELMNTNQDYKIRHLLNAEFKRKSFYTKSFTSLLQDFSFNQNIIFLQYNFLLEKTGKLKLGIHNIGDQKLDYLDPLNKHQFNKIVFFSNISKNENNLIDIKYTNRMDIKSQNMGSSNENTIELKTSFIEHKNGKINIQSSYSSYQSDIEDSIRIENNIMARLNYSFKINHYLNFSGFYEISNGKEFLRDFRYIKVNPGYGSFSWIDYNNNGLEEFDEFENSNFADTADYIRISFPTNESFNVRNLKYNQQINIHPDVQINKLLSRIQNLINIQINKKFLADDFKTIINPFLINFSNQNTLNVNYNVINNLIYKSNNNKYLFSYKIKKSLLKNTLNYGEESSQMMSHNIQGQRNFSFLVLNINWTSNEHSLNNQNMANRNYMINTQESRSELYFNFKKLSPSIVFTYVRKQNTNNEKLKGLKLNIGIDFSGPNQFSLQSHLIAFNMNYNGNELSSLGHDMLEGLSNGKGMEAQIGISKSINKTNFSIQYNGRFNESRIIHGGRFELKKYF